MKIVAIGNARLGSKRLKNKMLSKFGNTTLIDIALKRLAGLKKFDKVYFAVFEEELLDIAHQYLSKDQIIIRSKESATIDSPITKIHHYLENIESDYFMWINSCHSMLTSETLDKAANFFISNNLESMTSVIKKDTWFYDTNGKPVNCLDPAEQIQTDKSNSLYEVVHAFHIFNKQHFFKTGTYWNNKENDPYLYEINPIESLDVDNSTELFISQSVFNSSNSK